MLIAVTAEGPALSDKVSKRFDTCKYVLIVETDTNALEAVENTGDPAALAHHIAERDCEAVITGEFSFEIFNIIADACITRYKCDGCSAEDAVKMMDRNDLEYIRHADENDTCHGDHGSGVCNCGEHD